MKELLLAFGGAIIGGTFSLIAQLLTRKWQKADKKETSEAERNTEQKERDKHQSEQLDRIEKMLKKHIDENDVEFVVLARSRLLLFADEIRRGMLHSAESFGAINDDIRRYDEYCASHPDFPNSKAEAAKKIIKETYEKCVLNNAFI